MEQDTENSLFELSIDETAKDHLRKICSWTMIIVITAVIGVCCCHHKGPPAENPGCTK